VAVSQNNQKTPLALPMALYLGLSYSKQIKDRCFTTPAFELEFAHLRCL
jgi:hypothetical protein